MRGTGAGTFGDRRSLRNRILQKLFHERQTWNQCKKMTRKLVKSFAESKHAWWKNMHVKQICWLHPVNPPKHFFSQEKKKKRKVSTIFSRFQSQCLQPGACTCLSAIAQHSVSKISLWAYKRPDVSTRWPPKMTQ